MYSTRSCYCTHARNAVPCVRCSTVVVEQQKPYDALFVYVGTIIRMYVKCIIMYKYQTERKRLPDLVYYYAPSIHDLLHTTVLRHRAPVVYV